MADQLGSNFPQLVALMARLRGPGGCPWDREQTFDSIKPFLLEEAYEVLDAIGDRDWKEVEGELGDLLLQVVFFARMAEEQKLFTIEDVIERIHSKMVTRHPHVFGDADAKTAAEVLKNWEKNKAEEKRKQAEARGEEYRPPASLLEGVSAKIPSLMEALQLGARAAHVGFDWERWEDVMAKLREETAELEAEARLAAGPARAANQPADQLASKDAQHSPEVHARLEDEVGDLLFTAVNLARYLKVDPECALRGTNRKFRRRFQWIEQELEKAGRSPRDSTLAEMDALWSRSKQALEG